MLKDEIQKTITNSIASLKKQRNQLIYNKLYTDYKAANTKFQKLFTGELKEKEALKQVQKEQQKIETLLEKMDQFPELHKDKKQSIKHDAKARQNDRNRYYYNEGKKEDASILQEIIKIRENIQNQTALLIQKNKIIDRLQGLESSQPTKEQILKIEQAKMQERQEKKSLLIKKPDEAAKLLQNNPGNAEAPNKLDSVKRQLIVNRNEYEDARRAENPDNMHSHNVDHLENHKAQREEINSKIASYQNQEDDLQARLNKLNAEQNKLKEKIDAYQHEQKAQEIAAMKEQYKPNPLGIQAIYGQIARDTQKAAMDNQVQKTSSAPTNNIPPKSGKPQQNQVQKNSLDNNNELKEAMRDFSHVVLPASQKRKSSVVIGRRASTEQRTL